MRNEKLSEWYFICKVSSINLSDVKIYEAISFIHMLLNNKFSMWGNSVLTINAVFCGIRR